jgi:hypothetical protein
MADLPLTSAIFGLAGRAADLSSELYAVQESCRHTRNDVESVANEIAMLSASLWRLHEAMAEDRNRYTDSFNQDLAEITHELKIVFEEFSDCCEELRKADPSSGNAVSWLFKKSKVHHLQKHLEALKSTLIVMRTVLNHGKEYGVQMQVLSFQPRNLLAAQALTDSRHSSPRIAESLPHTMHEDRAILDAVFATNRNAIIDLHNLEHSRHAVGHSPEKDYEHDHICAASPRIPPLPDVLPVAPRSSPAAYQTTPCRSFSRRGMRLGVHMSILDMGAHTAPDALKNKWIQTSRSHHPAHNTMSGATSPKKPQDKTQARFPLEENPNKANLSPEKTAPPSTVGHGRKSGHGWISSPTADKLHKMIDHLELSHSTAISRMLPYGRRRSSVGKHPIVSTQTQTQELRRRRPSAAMQGTLADG